MQRPWWNSLAELFDEIDATKVPTVEVEEEGGKTTVYVADQKKPDQPLFPEMIRVPSKEDNR